MSDTTLLWLIMIFAGAIMAILFVDWFIDCRKGYFFSEINDLLDSARKSQEKRLINDRMSLDKHFKTSSFSSSQKEKTYQSKGSN